MKYVKTTTKPSGLRFVYYAKPGCKLVRLPNLPENDPTFLAAYAEAAQGAVRVPSKGEPGEGTIAALCASYRRSLAYRGLRTSTRQKRGPIVDKIAITTVTTVKPYRIIASPR